MKKKRRERKYQNILKTFYQRSAIAHGAINDVDTNDLQIAKQITKLMIITFLITSPFKEMKSMEELNAYMIDLKFK